MRRLVLISLLLALLAANASLFAASALPGAATDLQTVSIDIGTPTGGNLYDASRDVGLRILKAVKVVISGFALIYIIIIGVTMIVFSENEDKIKAQRRQFTYLLMGFLFLNIPGLVYMIFFGDVLGESRGGLGVVGDVVALEFWDTNTLMGINGFVPAIIGFFEIFIFGAAILTFTWGFFRLILSAGNEEVQKKAKNRILYGVLGLIFLGFAKVWGSVIAKGDFFGEFATIGRKLLGLALYFAAPVVIAFLALAAFYMITSAGDEEKVKKAKTIFINTLIATVILLGAYSFVTDLATFTI